MLRHPTSRALPAITTNTREGPRTFTARSSPKRPARHLRDHAERRRTRRTRSKPVAPNTAPRHGSGRSSAMTMGAGHDVERDGHDHHRRALPRSIDAEVTRSHTSASERFRPSSISAARSESPARYPRRCKAVAAVNERASGLAHSGRGARGVGRRLPLFRSSARQRRRPRLSKSALGHGFKRRLRSISRLRLGAGHGRLAYAARPPADAGLMKARP